MEAIKLWLDDPDRNYASGVELYAGQRCNKNILQLLRRKESPANVAKLIYELGKFAHAIDPAPGRKIPNQKADLVTQNPEPANESKPIAEVIQDNLAKQDQNDKLMFHDLPDTLRPVLMEKNQAYVRMCLLKVQLNEVPDEAEGQALALQLQLDDLWKFNALCWKKLDHWLEYRSVPPSLDEKLEAMTPDQRLRRQQLLYASKSKLEGRIAENMAELAKATDQRDVVRLQKAIAKASGNLIAQEELLLKITLIIEGRNG